MNYKNIKKTKFDVDLEIDKIMNRLRILKNVRESLIHEKYAENSNEPYLDWFEHGDEFIGRQKQEDTKGKKEESSCFRGRDGTWHCGTLNSLKFLNDYTYFHLFGGRRIRKTRKIKHNIYKKSKTNSK
jgi:hypothetical protein